MYRYTRLAKAQNHDEKLINDEKETGVTTFLIDEKGIILAKDLKGPALYASIKRLTN